MQLELPILVDYQKVNVSLPEKQATMTLFLLPASHEMPYQQDKPMVLVCPGGGYAFRSDREAEPIAMHFLAAGMHAAIVRYSCDTVRYPTAALELAWCVQECRRNAQQWHIRPDSIHVIGFSAGGHLACTLGTTWHWPVFEQALGNDVSCRPDSQILSYPVVTMGEFTHEGSRDHLLGENASQEAIDMMSLEKQVTSKTVPTFLWHTVEDGAVPVENSLQYAAALRRAGVPFEMHLYEKGHHGLSTCDGVTNPEGGLFPDNEDWLKKAIRFIRRRG